jgi:hypothetical protein
MSQALDHHYPTQHHSNTLADGGVRASVPMRASIIGSSIYNLRLAFPLKTSPVRAQVRASPG